MSSPVFYAKSVAEAHCFATNLFTTFATSSSSPSSATSTSSRTLFVPIGFHAECAFAFTQDSIYTFGGIDFPGYYISNFYDATDDLYSDYAFHTCDILQYSGNTIGSYIDKARQSASSASAARVQYVAKLTEMAAQFESRNKQLTALQVHEEETQALIQNLYASDNTIEQADREEAELYEYLKTQRESIETQQAEWFAANGPSAIAFPPTATLYSVHFDSQVEREEGSLYKQRIYGCGTGASNASFRAIANNTSVVKSNQYPVCERARLVFYPQWNSLLVFGATRPTPIYNYVSVTTSFNLDKKQFKHELLSCKENGTRLNSSNEELMKFHNENIKTTFNHYARNHMLVRNNGTIIGWTFISTASASSSSNNSNKQQTNQIPQLFEFDPIERVTHDLNIVLDTEISTRAKYWHYSQADDHVYAVVNDEEKEQNNDSIEKDDSKAKKTSTTMMLYDCKARKANFTNSNAKMLLWNHPIDKTRVVMAQWINGTMETVALKSTRPGTVEILYLALVQHGISDLHKYLPQYFQTREVTLELVATESVTLFSNSSSPICNAFKDLVIVTPQ